MELTKMLSVRETGRHTGEMKTLNMTEQWVRWFISIQFLLILLSRQQDGIRIV